MLDFSRSKDCIISKISRTPEVAANPSSNPPTSRFLPTRRTRSTFQISSVNRYVPAITLSVNDNITFLENLQQELKRTVPWKKYRS